MLTTHMGESEREIEREWEKEWKRVSVHGGKSVSGCAYTNRETWICLYSCMQPKPKRRRHISSSSKYCCSSFPIRQSNCIWAFYVSDADWNFCWSREIDLQNILCRTYANACIIMILRDTHDHDRFSTNTHLCVEGWMDLTSVYDVLLCASSCTGVQLSVSV